MRVSHDNSLLAAPMPNNVEAERALLGSLIIDNTQIGPVIERIPSSAVVRQEWAFLGRSNGRNGTHAEPLFYSAAHQMIFDAILSLTEKGSGVDLTTLAAELMQRGQLELVGGAPFIVSLEDDIFAMSQVADYANIVIAHWRRRSLIRACQSVIDEATNSQDPPEVIFGRAEKRVFDVLAAKKSGQLVDASSLIPDAILRIEEDRAGKPRLRGVPTGLSDIDRMLIGGGFLPNQLIILAARPSVGKSALSANIALNAAKRTGKWVLNFSLEMANDSVIDRLLAMESGVPTSLTNRRHSEDEMRRLHEAAARLDAAKIMMADSGHLTPLELTTQCRRFAARNPVALIVVDYLQLVTCGGKADTRNEEVSQVSRALKQLTMELKVPVLALSQFSREIERRTGKAARPKLSDLRDSGAIEQDGDIVCVLWREKEPTSWDADIQDIEFAFLKHRNGPLGQVKLMYQGPLFRFTCVAKN